MKIILKEDVQGLGYKDDVVEVKSGYGRNFLIPTGKAVIASPAALKMLAENLRQRAHKLEKIKNDAEALKAAIEAVEALQIAAKVSEAGTIYGSVSAAELVEALAAKGVTVDRKVVVLDPIKTPGNYSAKFNLHREVEAVLPFEVIAEVVEA